MSNDIDNISRSNHDAFFEGSPDCVKIIDLDGTLRAMNRNGMCLMEIDNFAAVHGGSWPSLWPAEVQPQIHSAMQAARTGGLGQFAAFCPTAKGTPKWWEVVVAPMLGSDGSLNGLLSISRDVTLVHQAQALQRATADKLRFALDVSQHGEWEIDLVTLEASCSLRHDQCFGYDRPVSGWTRDSWLARIVDDDRALVRDAWDQAVAQQGALRIECRVLWPDQSIHWISLHGSYHHGASGRPHMTGLISDATERMQNMQALREANRNKDEFLAMLAHELRNPLAPISSAAELLSMDHLQLAQVRKAGKIIVRQANHMNGLLDDLLDVARVTQGLVALEHDQVAVSEVIALAVEQVAPLIRTRGHTLTVPAQPVVATVQGDAKRLVQIVVNLLNNAAKYTGPGGVIALRASIQGSHLHLTVSDTGIGMAPATVDSAFELFSQAARSTERSTAGLGLGLALVKSLVERHGGTIAAFSAGVGLGSQFTLSLPIVTGALPAAAPPAAQVMGAGSTAGTARVLIADDNVDAAETLALYLEAIGYDVRFALSGHDALEAARDWTPTVFLLDIGLGDMTGHELGRRLRALPQVADALIVAISGYGSASDKQQSTEAGFDHHLTKPVDLSRLRQLLPPLV